MHSRYLIVFALLTGFSLFAQKPVDKGNIKVIEGGKGYYYESILKDINDVNDSLEKVDAEPYVRFNMDQSGKDMPTDLSLYEKQWTHPTESQGNGGTCWSFSTTIH